MELTRIAPLLGLLIGVAIIVAICLVAYGAYVGWNAAIRRFAKNRDDMARQFDKLDEVAQRDPARYGIDLGKSYAVQKMRETIDSIDAETN